MTSLCLTTNEGNVDKFLIEIVNQKQKPNEIVIIDSSVSPWQKNKNVIKKIKIKYFYKKCNISQGRNIAAKYASFNNLIFIDSGCVLDKNLIYEMEKSLGKRQSQIIAGRYISRQKNFKEYIFAKFLNKDISNSKTIYPSARVFGIKKSLFFKLKGFNENLSTAEDTEFFKRALDSGIKIEKNEKAIVLWKLPKTFEFFKKIFYYAKGDAESEIWWDKRKKFQTHNIKNLLTLTRWLVIFLLVYFKYTKIAVLFFLIYFAAVALKNDINFALHSKNSKIRIIINIGIYVIIKTLTDLTVSFGFLAGLF